MPKGDVRKRRYTSISDEQSNLLQAECKARGVPEYVVFHEIMDAGFNAYFDRAKEELVVRTELKRIGERLEEVETAIRQEGKACLASAAWSDYAMFGILRWLLMCEGQNVDNPGVTYCGMSRTLSETDSGTISGIWESAGKKMVAGGGFGESLASACKEYGVSWLEFSGTSADAARQEPPSKEKAVHKGRRKNGGKR
ncbi:MAG: hypothetical protein IJ111_07195 [Eggerthellaceae bacterium]|nr:hypothetical protein [Eggerthellaceae bacterium]